MFIQEQIKEKQEHKKQQEEEMRAYSKQASEINRMRGRLQDE